MFWHGTIGIAREGFGEHGDFETTWMIFTNNLNRSGNWKDFIPLAVTNVLKTKQVEVRRIYNRNCGKEMIFALWRN